MESTMLFESDNEVVESTSSAPAVRARARTGLSEAELRALTGRDKAYKVTDGQGMYVMVSPSGTKTFRYDYRLPDQAGKVKRETLTIGRYQPGTASRAGGGLMTLQYGGVATPVTPCSAQS